MKTEIVSLCLFNIFITKYFLQHYDIIFEYTIPTFSDISLNKKTQKTSQNTHITLTTNT